MRSARSGHPLGKTRHRPNPSLVLASQMKRTGPGGAGGLRWGTGIEERGRDDDGGGAEYFADLVNCGGAGHALACSSTTSSALHRLVRGSAAMLGRNAPPAPGIPSDGGNGNGAVAGSGFTSHEEGGAITSVLQGRLTWSAMDTTEPRSRQPRFAPPPTRSSTRAQHRRQGNIPGGVDPANLGEPRALSAEGDRFGEEHAGIARAVRKMLRAPRNLLSGKSSPRVLGRGRTVRRRTKAGSSFKPAPASRTASSASRFFVANTSPAQKKKGPS